MSAGERLDHLKVHELMAEDDLGDATPETVTLSLVKLLRERGSSLPNNAPRVQAKLDEGRTVTAPQGGYWWGARIVRDNGDGTYQISWSHPYQMWPHEMRQLAKDIRTEGLQAGDL